MPATNRSAYRIAILCPDLASQLRLERGVAKERLGSLFEINLSLYSTDKEIDLAAVLGKPMAVHVETDAGERYFHGIVSHFSLVGISTEFGHYQAVLRPKLWLLGESGNSRVFNGKSIADLLKDAFQRGGVDLGGVASTPAVTFDYCVQYRETDLHFVSRLMQRWGLYYFHKHEETKHTLEVVSSLSGHADVGDFPYAKDGGASDEFQITNFRIASALRSSNYRIEGTENLTRTAIDATEKSRFSIDAASSLKINDFEAVDEYPKPWLDELAKARMQAIDATVEEYSGTCRSPKIAVGSLFTLTGHSDKHNHQYLVVAAAYQFDGDMPGEAPSKDPYVVAFTAIDSKTPFSPPITTKKPVVQGPHLATVTKETDEFGRVAVKFHWGNPDDDTESCPARVSQNWAGKEWGGVFLPHVGHEVIVEFLDGDPDQPLVTGRVYNQENMPPLALPGDKQKSIIRDHGGNEIMMDGTDGAQKIRIFCPKESTEIVLGNSEEHKCEGDLKIDFKGSSIEKILKDKSIHVTGNLKCENIGDREEKTGGKTIIETVGDYILKRGASDHQNILGMTSKLIGGVKKEHIIGAEWKRIDGLKREKVKGAVMKDAPKEVLKFTEAMKQIGGLVYNKYDDLKHIIRRDMFLKTMKLQEEAEEKAEKAKKVEQDYETLTVKGKNHNHSPDKTFHVTTDNVMVMAKEITLIGDVFDVGGIFEIRK